MIMMIKYKSNNKSKGLINTKITPIVLSGNDLRIL